MKNRFWGILALFQFVCAGCAAPTLPREWQSPLEEWKFSDLIWLGNPDTNRPDQEPVALYYRQSLEKLQFRLDFLNLDPNNLPFFALYADFITSSPTAEKPPTIFPINPLVIQGTDDSGQTLSVEKRTTIPELTPKIVWEPPMDYVVVEIENPSFSSSRLLKTVRVEILRRSDHQPVFTTPTIPNKSISSIYKASLLLEFWDVMPGYTPAQTLRRWDGAHAGPFGQRHGLRYLLEAVSSTGIPVNLLDLKKPGSLAALNYLNRIDLIKDLENRGLLILPDAAYGDPGAVLESLTLSREAARVFGFSSEMIMYAPLSREIQDSKKYQAAFAVLSGSDTAVRWQNFTLVPLPESYPSDSSSPEIDREGLTMAAKRNLLEKAASGKTEQITVFGGSLPSSAWGDSTSSQLAMNYIRTHPWINALSKEEMIALPTIKTHLPEDCSNLLCTTNETQIYPFNENGEKNFKSPSYSELKRLIRDEIRQLPENQLKNTTWQAFLNLTRPTMNPDLIQLQANYINQMGHLLAAAKWSSDPVEMATCSLDLDWDGENECLLSNRSIFTSYELNGARLIVLFSNQSQESKQWIGPASQFSIGLSDPHDWKLERGAASDPNEIPGAFADLENTFQPFSASISKDQVTFTSEDQTFQKTFTLQENHLIVSYHTENEISTRIPVIFHSANPRFTGWIDCPPNSTKSPPSDCPRIPDFSTVNSSLDWITFSDSYSMMGQPENPGYGYPPGHYLPFPLGLITLTGDGDFSIHFSF